MSSLVSGPVGSTITTAVLSARLSEPELTIVDVRPLHALQRLALERRAAAAGTSRAQSAFPSSWLAEHGRRRGRPPARVEGHRPGPGGRPLRRRRTDVARGRNPARGARPYRHPRLRELGRMGRRRVAAARAAPEPLRARPHGMAPASCSTASGPEAAPAGRFLLFHVNFGVPEEYEENHLPGALYLDTNRLENPVDWNRRTPEELEAALRALGITHDTTVILYGRDTEGDANEKWPGRRAGQIAATRAAMILRYAGVDDIRLLDGGLRRLGRGPATSSRRTLREPSPVETFGVAIPLRPGGDRRHRRGQADPRRPGRAPRS